MLTRVTRSSRIESLGLINISSSAVQSVRFSPVRKEEGVCFPPEMEPQSLGEARRGS